MTTQPDTLEERARKCAAKTLATVCDRYNGADEERAAAIIAKDFRDEVRRALGRVECALNERAVWERNRGNEAGDLLHATLSDIARSIARYAEGGDA